MTLAYITITCQLRKIRYNTPKQPLWAVFRLDSRKGGQSMIIIPMSWFELLLLILTALLVYVTWKACQNTKK